MTHSDNLTTMLQIIIIVFVVLSIIFIVAMQYVAMTNVVYSIQLKEKVIEKGDQLIVFYRINNGLSEYVDEVVLQYWVDDGDRSIENLPKIDPGESLQDHINIYTDSLSAGEHIVFTRLSYKLNDTIREEELSLVFDIF